ncbi:unnamed protein product [Cochlearia groenlandica]
MMDSLPNEILDDILFKLDLESLAMLQCTNRSPLTSTCTLVDLFKSKFLPHIITLRYEKARLKEGKANCIGFVVDQIKQQFKIVCVNETREKSDGETVVYQFEIHTGDPSWRLSETTITCLSSKLMPDKKPAYFNGCVHWLREDGSILAFNTEEAARLIPIKLLQEVEEGEEEEEEEEEIEMEKEEEQGGDYNGVVHVFDLEPKKNYIDQEMITDHIDGMSSGDMKYYLLERSNRFGNRWFGQVEPPPKLRMVSQGCNTREKSHLLLLINDYLYSFV